MGKRASIILTILLAIISLICLRPSPMSTTEYLYEEGLEKGDIIFVDIYSGWCLYGYWDHIALYVGEQAFPEGYRSLAVVENTYKSGVTMTSLQSFLKRDEPAVIKVKRLRGVPGREKLVNQAVDYALSHLGTPMDFLFVPQHKNGAKAQHCAEIIWRAYKSAGIDLDSNRGLFLHPDDIYYSSFLEGV